MKGLADRLICLAEKSGLSLSQYIQNILEDHIRSEDAIAPGDNLDTQFEKLKEQHSRLEDKASDIEERFKPFDALMQIIKETKKNSKNEPFQECLSFGDVEEYKSEIVTLLKEQDVVKEQELLDLLCVEPTDIESVKVVNRQLDNLLGSNLIKRSNGEIIWVK